MMLCLAAADHVAIGPGCVRLHARWEGSAETLRNLVSSIMLGRIPILRGGFIKPGGPDTDPN